MPTVNVRYVVDDVDAAVTFYTTHLDFRLLSRMPPRVADVTLGRVQLTACADPVQRARVLELLQELEVEVQARRTGDGRRPP
jgi:catechol 2,3-dioxygenase-like lactoylglutathione lyase family enzyme